MGSSELRVIPRLASLMALREAAEGVRVVETDDPVQTDGLLYAVDVNLNPEGQGDVLNDLESGPSTYMKAISGLNDDLLKTFVDGEFGGTSEEFKDLARLGRRLLHDFGAKNIDLPEELEGGFATPYETISPTRNGNETKTDLALSSAKELIALGALNLIKSDVEIILLHAGKMWSFAMHALKDMKKNGSEVQEAEVVGVNIETSVERNASILARRVRETVESIKHPSVVMRLFSRLLGDKEDGWNVGDGEVPFDPTDQEFPPKGDTWPEGQLPREEFPPKFPLKPVRILENEGSVNSNLKD